MRLDKLLEQEQFGSRRKVKALIHSKQVRVDGLICMEESQNVDPSVQKIHVNKQQINQSGHVYYLLNKPHGVVTALSDNQHKTVMALIRPSDKREGLFPVGRLDRDTEGLLLLTDNGQLGYQFMQPNKKVTKQYRVTVNERLTSEDCVAFASGIVFHGGQQCKPAELRILTSSNQESTAIVTITEGKFHQVKKMFLAVGKKVTALTRVSMGPIFLDESLAVGDYRPLRKQEIQQLLPYFTSHKKEKSVNHEI